jgi:F0F1-type ATP synthase membrane subunit b/b'
MLAFVGIQSPQVAALVDLDATYFIQMALFLVLYILLSQVFFKTYVGRLRRRDEAGHGLRQRAKDALISAKDMDADAERRMSEARHDAVLERRKLAEAGVALRDSVVAKERQHVQASLDVSLAALEAEKAGFMTGVDSTAGELALLIEKQMQSVEAR